LIHIERSTAKTQKLGANCRTRENTITAFRSGADQIEMDYQEELTKFGQVLYHPKKVKEAEEMVSRYMKVKDFFSGMPWFLLGAR